MKIVNIRDLIVGRFDPCNGRVLHVAFVIPCGTEVIPIPNDHPAAYNSFGCLEELFNEIESGECDFDFVLPEADHERFLNAIAEANDIQCWIDDFADFNSLRPFCVRPPHATRRRCCPDDEEVATTDEVIETTRS